MLNTVNYFGLAKHIRMQTKVISTSWDPKRQKWTVNCQTGTSEKTYESDILVHASGPLHHANKPHFKVRTKL